MASTLVIPLASSSRSPCAVAVAVMFGSQGLPTRGSSSSSSSGGGGRVGRGLEEDEGVAPAAVAASSLSSEEEVEERAGWHGG